MPRQLTSAEKGFETDLYQFDYALRTQQRATSHAALLLESLTRGLKETGKTQTSLRTTSRDLPLLCKT